MKTFITTIGTSLLTNPDRPWAPWRHDRSPIPDPTAVDAWLAKADHASVSAETNSWSKLSVFDADARQRVLLLHTRSPDGGFCAERLGALLDDRGISMALHEIPELSPNEENGFARGLAQLARQVALHVRNARLDGDVAIVATGGFKAETAMVNLVGALTNVPVHYIHERFRDIVTIEPLPVGLDLSLLQDGAGARVLQTFSSADATVERRQVESLLKSEPRLELFVEENDIDGMAYLELNAVGQLAHALATAPAPNWPSISALAPHEKVHLEAGHHRPQGWERFVDSIARNSYVSSIRYQDASRGRTGIEIAPDAPSDVLARFSDGDQTIRLRVATTATTEAQRALLLPHLRKSLR